MIGFLLMNFLKGDFMKFEKAYSKLIARECEYICRKSESVKLIKLDQDGQAVIVSTHNPGNGKYEIHRERWRPSIDDKTATDWGISKLKYIERNRLISWFEITFKF